MIHKTFLIVMLALFGFSFPLQAQPTLPDVSATTQNGINILSWVNPFTNGVASVSIQRSADSNHSFQTIGYIKNVTLSKQAYIDAHPLLGNNWYRVKVSFSSGTEWISNIVNLQLDSADLIKQKPMPSNDSLQELVAKMKTSSPTQTVNHVSQIATRPKSSYVFTNPFTGNIDIELKDAFVNDYALYFYDQSGKEVLAIPRINDTTVILDKRNFNASGLFKFKLLKNNQEFADGYVTIY